MQEGQKIKNTPPPGVDEVAAYCRDRQNAIDPAYFVDRYSAVGWVNGGGLPITDWQAEIRVWERNGFNKPKRGAASKNKQARKSRVPTDEELKNWNPVDGGLGADFNG